VRTLSRRFSKAHTEIVCVGHTIQNTQALSRSRTRHCARIAVEAQSSPMGASIVLSLGAFISGNWGAGCFVTSLWSGRSPRRSGCGCEVRDNRSFERGTCLFRFTIFTISPAATAQIARCWYEQDQANPEIARRCSEMMIK